MRCRHATKLPGRLGREVPFVVRDSTDKIDGQPVEHFAVAREGIDQHHICNLSLVTLWPNENSAELFRYFKAELFGLIRLPSGERLATEDRMTNAVIEPAFTSDKPKRCWIQCALCTNTRAISCDALQILYSSSLPIDGSSRGQMIDVYQEQTQHRRHRRSKT